MPREANLDPDSVTERLLSPALRLKINARIGAIGALMNSIRVAIGEIGVTGSGTVNKLMRWTGSRVAGDSIVHDDETNVSVGIVGVDYGAGPLGEGDVLGRVHIRTDGTTTSMQIDTEGVAVSARNMGAANTAETILADNITGDGPALWVRGGFRRYSRVVTASGTIYRHDGHAMANVTGAGAAVTLTFFTPAQRDIGMIFRVSDIAYNANVRNIIIEAAYIDGTSSKTVSAAGFIRDLEVVSDSAGTGAKFQITAPPLG